MHVCDRHCETAAADVRSGVTLFIRRGVEVPRHAAARPTAYPTTGQILRGGGIYPLWPPFCSRCGHEMLTEAVTLPGGRELELHASSDLNAEVPT